MNLGRMAIHRRVIRSLSTFRILGPRGSTDRGYLVESIFAYNVRTIEGAREIDAGLFEENKDEISFERLGRKRMTRVIEEVFSGQVGRPKRNGAAPRGKEDPRRRVGGSSELSAERRTAGDGVVPRGSALPEAGEAVGKFLEAGLALLESLSAPQGISVSDGSEHSRKLNEASRPCSKPMHKTQRATLVIPLPASVTVERLASALSGLLGRWAGAQ
jgi:hypothetical protein